MMNGFFSFQCAHGTSPKQENTNDATSVVGCIITVIVVVLLIRGCGSCMSSNYVEDIDSARAIERNLFSFDYSVLYVSVRKKRDDESSEVSIGLDFHGKVSQQGADLLCAAVCSRAATIMQNRGKPRVSVTVMGRNPRSMAQREW